MKKKFKFFVCVAVSIFYTSEIAAQTSLTTKEDVLQAIENNALMPSEIIKAGDTIFLDTSTTISSSRKKFLRWRRNAMPRSDYYGSTPNSTPQDFYNYLNGMSLGLACQSGPAESVWRSLGPNPDPSMRQDIGLVSNVACHPNNENIIYAGTEESGLWKTINGGVDWVNITDNLNRINMGVATISIDPTNANNIVIGTNSGSFIYPDKGTTAGHGIFYSLDGGSNWTKSTVSGNPSTYWAAENIQRQPSNANVLICAGGKNIYKSTDGGQNWTSVFANTTQGDHNKLFKVEFSLDPAKTGEVYVSTRLKDYGTPKVFFSSNTGNAGSWVDITPPNSSTSQMIELATTADDVLHVYAAFKQVGNSADQTYILKTNDGGQNWTTVSTSSPESSFGSWRLEFEISDGDAAVMYAGGNEMWKSTNSGSTWAKVSDYYPSSASTALGSTHADIRSIFKIGYQNGEDKLFMGNDGGISKTINSAASWTNLNGNGLAITQFCGLDAFWTRDEIIGGSIHNGHKQMSNGTWQQHAYSDYGYTLVDHNDEDEKYYYTLNYATLEKYDVTTGSSESIISLDGVLGAKFHINPHNHHEVLFGGRVKLDPNDKHATRPVFILKINTDGPNSFTNIFTAEAADETLSWPSVIKISPTNPQVMWLALKGQTGGFSNKEYKIYKTIDGGTNWTNLTTSFSSDGINKLTIWSYVTDIAFHPNNEDEVYFTMANYKRNANDPTIGEERVIRTLDGGVTFEDMSVGLAPVPVNSIQFYGTEQLYIGTDAGVFYNDLDHSASNTLTSWHCFNNGFPNSVISQLELDPCGKKIYAATLGRGAWETDLPDPVYAQAMEINTSQTWTSFRNIHSKVVVKPGVTLTIKDCTIKFSGQGYIEVRPGGYLVVDNSELTAMACAVEWGGICVAGVSNLPQDVSTHGKVTLMGGSIISNSGNGILNTSLSAQNEPNMAESGGIIDARSVSFKNNARDVQLLKYRNGSADYKAVFEGCTFIRDNNYGIGNMLPNVTMWAVNGVKIAGCVFTNNNDTQFPRADGTFLKKGAIYTENASYKIVSAFFGTTEFKNTFAKYDRTIRSTFNICNQTIQPLVIEDAEFTDNIRSIYLSGAEFPRIVRNEIKIHNDNGQLGSTPIPNEVHYGIYLDQSYGFQLHSNILTTETFTNSVSTIGMIFNNSANGYVEAYGNQVDGFKIGFAAYGNNQADNTGLNFHCNELGSSVTKGTSLGNRTDIFVKGLTGSSVNPDEGIDGTQTGSRGGVTLRNVAINHFTPGATNHIANLSQNFIAYFYDGSGDPRMKPTMNTLGLVHAQDIRAANPSFNTVSLAADCPTKNKKESDTFGQYISDIAWAEGELVALETVLNNLLNSENIAAIEAQILFADDQEEYQDLYLNMMAESPFVDDQLLLDVLELPGFPELAIRNLFVANPQSAREEHIWDELINRLPALSQLTLNDIEAEQKTITARDILEMEISGAQAASEYASIRLIELYNTDENADHVLDITNHLKSRDEAYFRYALIDHYYSVGDITNAQAERIALPGECELNDFQNNEYNSMEVLYSLYENHINNIKGIEDEDLQTLQDIVDADLGYRSEAKARSLIIVSQGSVNYEEPIYFPPSSSSKKEAFSMERPLLPEIDFSLAPNPAEGGTTLFWNSKKLVDVEEMEIRIVDMQGKLQLQVNISDLDLEMKFIDVSSFKSGVYIFQVLNDEQELYHEKLIIQQ